MSPCDSALASRKWTSPSMSGASALDRPVAPPSSSTASMITSIVRPTLARNLAAEMAALFSMKRA
jgi:hypothetical protein